MLEVPLSIALAKNVREFLLHIFAVELRYAERLSGVIAIELFFADLNSGPSTKTYRPDYSCSVFRYSRKSLPRSSRLRANSTVAFRKPNLSPASWRLPSKVKP